MREMQYHFLSNDPGICGHQFFDGEILFRKIDDGYFVYGLRAIHGNPEAAGTQKQLQFLLKNDQFVYQLPVKTQFRIQLPS